MGQTQRGVRDGTGPYNGNGPAIDCQFNLLQEGRKYTGHHRQYVIDNARAVCYAPETREGIRLREKLGYLGHGRRQMAGKVAIAESERVKMPDGSYSVIDNIPACVTTAFEIDEAGNVSHTQELLTGTEPGRIVQGLHGNRVGGFSWAMAGRDGGAHGVTKVTSFEGFDYVMNPGFAHNRGYVLESAGRDLVLESICRAGFEDVEAEKIMHRWIGTALFQVDELTERLANAEIFEDALIEKAEKLEAEVKTAAERDEARKAMIVECAQKLPVVVPADVAESMISMASEADFLKVIGFFENASRADLGRYPLPGMRREDLLVNPPKRKESQPPEYGRAAAAIDFDAPGYLR